MSTRATIGIACLLMIAASAWPQGGFAAQQQKVSQRGTVDADVEVEIDNVVGSLRVTGWDRDEIQVDGTLGEGTERLAFENDGERVEIRVVIPRSRRRDPERLLGDTHIEVMVPRAASVNVETLAASIAVLNVDGPISVESSAGGVTYSGGAVEIEAGSVAGDIEIDSTASGASVDVESVAGNVMVQFADASIQAVTLSGTLRVIGGTIREGDLESVSGSLYFEGAIGADTELGFESFGGDIELLVPTDTAADFDIETYSGTIETEFGFEGRTVEAYSPRQEAEFTLGSGGDAAVSIETFSGSVRVRQR